MVPVPYSFYVLFVGFSEVHHISMKRVVLALVGIPTAPFLLLAALMIGLIFITEQSSSSRINPHSTLQNTLP